MSTKIMRKMVMGTFGYANHTTLIVCFISYSRSGCKEKRVQIRLTHVDVNPTLVDIMAYS